MSDRIDQKNLVDTRVAARILDLSPHTLALMRRQNRGPAFYRVGTKAIRYDIKDLDEFAKRVEP